MLKGQQRKDAGRALSPREAEILDGTKRGLSAAAIAVELSISPHTVRQHLKTIYRKFEVKNRTGLVVEMARCGLIG